MGAMHRCGDPCEEEDEIHPTMCSQCSPNAAEILALGVVRVLARHKHLLRLGVGSIISVEEAQVGKGKEGLEASQITLLEVRGNYSREHWRRPSYSGNPGLGYRSVTKPDMFPLTYRWSRMQIRRWKP
jgi:hypothetical protein